MVVYHFGAKWLPGGFIGVDVFFVISGFLISKSIYRELDNGTFSIADFYVRRARRIIPAFLAVSLATTILAALILFPNQLVEFAKSLVYSAFFLANAYFYSASDYFAPAAEEIPLLHYWSLGVEEQFYILFPLLAICCYRFSPRLMPAAVLLLGALSLIAAEWMLSVDPAAAFYLLPFRAFEILIGSVLALPGFPFSSDRRTAAGAVIAGVSVILGGMVFIDSSVPFPGVTALIPCLGAAAIIWGGERVTTAPARMLGSSPMLFWGAISYSLYLVHWPIVVFSKMVMPDIDPLVFLIGGCLASTALAWLSYRFVEQPFRHGVPVVSRKYVMPGSGAALTALVAVGLFIQAADGFPGRVQGSTQKMLSYLGYDYQSVFREGTCFLRPEQDVSQLDWKTCLPEVQLDVVIWGSSHIAQLYLGMESELDERKLTFGQITGSGCIPLVGYDNVGRPNCRALNDFALAYFLANPPSIVVMGGDLISDAGLLALLDASVDRLTEAGIRVVVLGPVPYFNRPVPIILASRIEKENRDTSSLGELNRESIIADEFMEKFYESDGGEYLSALRTMCPAMKCELQRGEKPLHFDVVHLTDEGSRVYGRKIIDSILQPEE
ncbi:peptidoglycan/LPS O-acetylase OafA/YrhL [Aurantimonas endophytica]|uniref:Peptidoglycan/LPS O-acetylase OafA/YrhL n=1 Tax=Aurantimonas endophytica TaxID=1522175 RepID=A0A7W6HDD9_9HYPH|nr:peptidoglycan/LPS O-acetylase OafA/YrhL [Aurantimonas endophytica]